LQFIIGPCGKSHKPARILLVGTHPDTANCRKNVVGEYKCQDTDIILGKILNEFGNVFNIHAHAFLIDANVSNSASMKAFKTALSDFKTEIVDVSLHTIKLKAKLKITFGFFSKGREAKSLNVLAENEFIGLDCSNGDLSYTLVSQREPDHKVSISFKYSPYSLLNCPWYFHIKCSKLLRKVYEKPIPK